MTSDITQVPGCRNPVQADIGLIYLIAAPDSPLPMVKIGYTTNSPSTRLSQLKTGNPHAVVWGVIPGTREDEKALHEYFKAVRIDRDREWFQYTDPLTTWMEWLGRQPFLMTKDEDVNDPVWGALAYADMPRFPWQQLQDDPFDLTLFDAVESIYGVLLPLPSERRQPRNSNEYYTPPRFLTAARTVMGTIDLDPASSHVANRTVRAAKYYTHIHKGESTVNPWFGNVWCNPPYGEEQIPFVNRAIAEYKSGGIRQAILCLNGNAAFTSNKWFAPLWDYTLCIPTGRVPFIGGPHSKQEDDPNNRPSNATVFVYIGPHNDRFAQVFGEFGPVVRKVAA